VGCDSPQAPRQCETAEDPHSPQQVGINRVLWTGVLLYVKESYNRDTMTRYGHGTPDDWLERNVLLPLFDTRHHSDGRRQRHAVRRRSGAR